MPSLLLKVCGVPDSIWFYERLPAPPAYKAESEAYRTFYWRSSIRDYMPRTASKEQTWV